MFHFVLRKGGLYYLLKSLDLSKDDEVILTPLQIPDYLNIINEFKLKPVFIEMDKILIPSILMI